MPANRTVRPAEAAKSSHEVLPPLCGGMPREPETDPLLDFAHSVAAGLERNPPALECRFLYDEIGSRLFEEICAQPEYYLTRTEAALLARHAAEICALAAPATLLELGSGSSTKTGTLLSACLARGGPAHYLPVDVSESALRQVAEEFPERYPGARVTPVHGTFEEAFPLLQNASPSLTLFLGSTLGNLDEPAATLFFRRLSRRIPRGDFLLLGVDLEKDRRLLEAAYNDAAGVTARFTLNLFARMNRELGSGLDLTGLEHLARWRPERRRIEIHARFRRPQTLRVAPLQRAFDLAAGELVLVEISRKFRLAPLLAELARHGLRDRAIYTDEQNFFALLLLQKA